MSVSDGGTYMPLSSLLRQFVLKHRVATLIAAILAVCLAYIVATFSATIFEPQAPVKLKILVWEGYAPAALIGSFETQCRCEVSVEYMPTSDDLKDRVSHESFDVISPSSDIAHWLVEHKLVQPLDVGHIPAFTSLTRQMSWQLEPVQDKTWFDLHIKGKPSTFGIPFMWGANVLLYNPAMFSSAPTSWDIVWSDEFQHKIALWDDISTVYMTAQVLKYDQQNDRQLYSLTGGQLSSIGEKLSLLRGNIYLWKTSGDLKQMFKKHRVVIALGWPLTANELRAEGMKIERTIPGRTTGWIDYLMIPRTSDHPELAQQLINYLMETKSQALVAETTGYVPANRDAITLMNSDDAEWVKKSTADFAKISFWTEVRGRENYRKVLKAIR